MERRRINNDLKIDWSITRGDAPEDFNGRKVTVRLRHESGSDAAISWNIEGNTIHITYFGMDQKKTGRYMLICTENDGEPDMSEVDHCEAVELVRHSCEEGGESCSNLLIGTISLSSDVKMCRAGLSAYEIACRWGFVGTEEEWLISLKGDKGDPGKDGSLLYPTYFVDAEMMLKVKSTLPTDHLAFDQKAGKLLLKL